MELGVSLRGAERPLTPTPKQDGHQFFTAEGPFMGPLAAKNDVLYNLFGRTAAAKLQLDYHPTPLGWGGGAGGGEVEAPILLLPAPNCCSPAAAKLQLARASCSHTYRCSEAAAPARTSGSCSEAAASRLASV